MRIVEVHTIDWARTSLPGSHLLMNRYYTQDRYTYTVSRYVRYTVNDKNRVRDKFRGSLDFTQIQGKVFGDLALTVLKVPKKAIA